MKIRAFSRILGCLPIILLPHVSTQKANAQSQVCVKNDSYAYQMDFKYRYSPDAQDPWTISQTTNKYWAPDTKCLSFSGLKNNTAIQVNMQAEGGVATNCGGVFNLNTSDTSTKNYTAKGTVDLPSC